MGPVGCEPLLCVAAHQGLKGSEHHPAVPRGGVLRTSACVGKEKKRYVASWDGEVSELHSGCRERFGAQCLAQGHIDPERAPCATVSGRIEMNSLFSFLLRRLLSPSQRVEESTNEKRQQKHADDESVHRSLVFFHVSKEDIWTAMQARQRGSGSGEAAHPSPSLRIRTICTGALERVILSMQSRCHAVSVCYTSAESANLHPHRFTKKNHTHTLYASWTDTSI